MPHIREMTGYMGMTSKVPQLDLTSKPQCICCIYKKIFIDDAQYLYVRANFGSFTSDI